MISSHKEYSSLHTLNAEEMNSVKHIHLYPSLSNITLKKLIQIPIGKTLILTSIKRFHPQGFEHIGMKLTG